MSDVPELNALALARGLQNGIRSNSERPSRFDLVPRKTHRLNAKDFPQRSVNCKSTRRGTRVDPLLISAASGMKARMESLDMLANNLANTGTSGFKADREFYTLYQQALPLVETRWTDFSQGMVLPTGKPLDLALSGRGFFALNGPGGAVYTRNGNFRISTRNQLESAEGYPLRNLLDMGRPIPVDPQQEIAVSKDGTVTQGGQSIGQIEIASLPTAVDQVAKLGSSYFALVNSAAGGLPAPATEVLEGQLEQSNVPVADSAVRLVTIMRQFEMLQKAVNIGSEMSKEAIQEVAKVG